jgi:putative endonuclease
MNKGQEAESLAAAYLAKRGYSIVAKNVRFPFGELDIIARDREILVFVEVKHRRNSVFGMPFEAVTKAKQRKIILAAHAYLKQYSLQPLCRFDIISLTGDLKKPLIEHMSDAFCLEDFNGFA